MIVYLNIDVNFHVDDGYDYEWQDELYAAWVHCEPVKQEKIIPSTIKNM